MMSERAGKKKGDNIALLNISFYQDFIAKGFSPHNGCD